MINYMEENCETWSPSPPKRQVPPMITLPSRPSLDNYVTGLSPGPMTLVSNFFADHYPDTDLSSFSKLLAEVLPSPIAPNSLSPLINREFSSNCQNISEESKKIRQDIAPQSSNSEAEPVVSVTNNPASDGYNWRKYGQKQVKSSDLPRCYYKCSQIDCPVTKKVGHYLDGNISDIIYKGQHNHEPPPCPKRVKYGAAMDQHTIFVGPTDAHQQSNHIVLNEVMTDERKRKMEVGSADQVSLSRVMITEPKIVVQTRSEVDILDDGFKWRKYGQKVVKGNTYPRGYYKCAYAGCKVRKHVERASSDPKSVVTTYEGKHKHDIPVVAKPLSSTVTNLKTESPFLLQLKEEQITT